MKMTAKIVATVFATLPIVMAVSYYIGARLSGKIVNLVEYLHDIEKMQFRTNQIQTSIHELQEINTSANRLSHISIKLS